MKIAITVPFEESVPPHKYGGTELVAYNLTEQLVKMGHEVTLLASGDSITSAKLEFIFKRSLRSILKFGDMKTRDAYKFMGIGKVVTYLKKNEFDIVHNHIGWRLLPFENVFGCPTVTTLHGPLDVPYQQTVYGEYKNSNYISISMNQRKPMPELNFVANVYNGIEIDKFEQNYEPENYFVFLGRMSPEKGPVQAIQVAKKASVKLIMAAKVDLVDEEYFKKEVEPLIDDNQIKFIGEVDHEEKIKLLGKSKGLIAPIQWEEPFGLFFTEAMVCGAPVFAMRRGSVPEIIIDKKTGFICDSVDEIAEKIKRVDEIDRKICFERVKKNFSSEKMAKDYIKAYEKVINKQ
ncbi:MAG: glycosyltransferase family 4 protein [Candidatus Moranbacteria bacterium]|nr:glycosyltransferase family 4 protein [Candidatus Moranbacteria bacterium]